MLPTAGERVAFTVFQHFADAGEWEIGKRPSGEQAGCLFGIEGEEEFEILAIAQGLGGSATGRQRE